MRGLWWVFLRATFGVGISFGWVLMRVGIGFPSSRFLRAGGCVALDSLGPGAGLVSVCLCHSRRVVHDTRKQESRQISSPILSPETTPSSFMSVRAVTVLPPSQLDIYRPAHT